MCFRVIHKIKSNSMVRLEKVVIVLLSVAMSHSLFGQKVSNIDFDEIKLATQDSSSNYYYPSLIERFYNLDASLSKKEYEYIYFGNVFTDHYNPYGSSESEKKFLEMFRQGKFDEAVLYGQEVISENPVNLGILFRMLICHHRLGDKVNAQKYADMYYPLISAIYRSGDGKSIKTAYVVIKVSDEYVVLNDLDLTMTKQALVGYTDVLTINTIGQKAPKGQKKIKSLYFNVSKPFESLQRLFKKEE